jgi:uroporphyrinogen-III synthase
MTGRPSPLAGRRVVVTRAAGQADDLVALLAARGAAAVVVPLVEMVPVPEAVARLATLRPDDFEWLVVTSPNGAHSYAAAHHLAPSGVAAVGTATATALREHGIAATLVPQEQRAAGLLAEFPACRVGGASVLLVQAVGAEPAMADGLSALGWQVTVVAPYRTTSIRPSAEVQLAALAADAVLFASGSAARAWVDVFGTSAPPIVVAMGPRTAAATRGFGLKVSAVATDHSLQGLVAALERLLDPTV